MSNEIAKRQSFSAIVNATKVKQSIMNTLQDESRAKRFTTAIVTAVNNNPALQECDAITIISGALLGESLNLSPSPQLGQYYLVPFNDSKRGCKVAQFQLGYKGYIQLAIRSGEYKKLNVISIKKGELVKFDPLNEEIEVNIIENPEEREAAETIGYYAMFEYINGFRKALYWSKEKMEAHAEKYSQGYRARKGYTFWEKDFYAMAYKTMLRQLISKWGIMSIEMRDALQYDNAIIRENGQSEHIEHFETETDKVIVQDEPDEAVSAQAGTENQGEMHTISMDEL